MRFFSSLLEWFQEMYKMTGKTRKILAKLKEVQIKQFVQILQILGKIQGKQSTCWVLLTAIHNDIDTSI